MNSNMNCISARGEVTFGVNVFLHSLILFTFLTVFFIVFVSKLMKDAFDNEIMNLLDKNLGGFIDNLDDNSKRNISLYLKLIPLDTLIRKYRDPSEYVVDHNKWVRMTAVGVAVVGVIMVMLVVGLLYYSCGQCIPLWEIIKENVIIFACVGVVEYLFFTNIAIKFIPAPPSLLVKTLVDKFKEELTKN